MTKSNLLLCTAALACGFSFIAPGPANAALVCAAGVCSETLTVPATTTNFSGSLAFDKFDPTAISGGATLISVGYSMSGDVFGDAKAEAIGLGASNIVLTLLATLTASKPASAVVVTTVLPSLVQNFSATAFNGVIDFGGTSGATFTGLHGVGGPITATLFAPADLALFTGTGTVLVPYAGTGASTGTGSGNLITQFATDAALQLTITYNYTNDVPEPASMAILGLGLSAVGFIRRRRAN